MAPRKPTTGCASRRGNALLLPYGVARDGRLLRASAVPAGLACGCACPACGAPLVARRGAVLAAHFAHAASDQACTAANETLLHRLAKQLIADGAPLTLPEVTARHAGRRRLVRPAATIRAGSATLEPGLDGLRPDVIAIVAGRPLLVEVAVTHFCGPDKAALIQKRRLAAVEIDLSGLARDTLPEELERALLHSAPRQWLWNRHAEAAEAEMRTEAERLAARRASRRERALERVARELAAEAAAPPPQDQAAIADAVREAGLCGAVRIVVAGDGCFAAARKIWQSRLVLRHVLGGIPLDPAAEATSLRPMLQRGFAEPRPGGFEWPEISARWPALRSPSEVVTDYARALGVMGLLKRDADGLWRRTGDGGHSARRALRHHGRSDGVPRSRRASWPR